MILISIKTRVNRFLFRYAVVNFSVFIQKLNELFLKKLKIHRIGFMSISKPPKQNTQPNLLTLIEQIIYKLNFLNRIFVNFNCLD